MIKSKNKRKKAARNPPANGLAFKYLADEPKDSRFGLVMQLATRRDLKLTELRLAVYLVLLADFKKQMQISTSTLGSELGVSSNHIAIAARELARLGIVGRVTKTEPYKYRLNFRERSL